MPVRLSLEAREDRYETELQAVHEGEAAVLGVGVAAFALERHFGTPQDVEFLISGADDTLYLVQSRPITAFSYSPDKVRVEEQQKLSDILNENRRIYHQDPVLSSTNIVELFPRAIPLGYSIFKYGFAGTLELKGGISIGRSRLGYAGLDPDDLANPLELLLLPHAHVVGDAMDVSWEAHGPEFRSQAARIHDRILLGEQHAVFADADLIEDLEGFEAHRPATDDQALDRFEGEGADPLGVLILEAAGFASNVMGSFDGSSQMVRRRLRMLTESN